MLSLLISHSGMSQLEQLHVQTDRGFYLSGENIWFKISLLNKDTANIKSGVAHIQLLSPEGGLVDSQKLKLEGRVADGMISLPVTSDEAYYLLRAYTRHNLNYGSAGIWQCEIPVYNPLETSLSSINDSLKRQGHSDLGEGVNISLDKVEYSTREEIDLKVSLDEPASLSIVMLDSFTYHSLQDNMILDQAPLQSTDYSAQTSLVLEGSLVDSDSGKPVTSPVISVYNGESANFLRARSDSGLVSIDLPDFDGISTFQVFNLNPYQKPVNDFNGADINLALPPFTSSRRPPVTSGIADYILKAKKRRKIHELFGMDLYRSKVEERFFANVTVPDHEYDMVKYQNIKTLEEFIDEGIFTAKVSRRKGETRIRLYNVEDRFTFPDAPWYIVDGILTSDESRVLEIPFRDISKVRIFTKTSTIKKYFEHFLWRNGVVEVLTSDVKYRRQFSSEPNTIKIEGFRNSPSFFDTLPDPGSELPDIRNVIAWVPDVEYPGSGEVTVKVPHSDDSGVFYAVVTAVTKSGRLLHSARPYRVK